MVSLTDHQISEEVLGGNQAIGCGAPRRSTLLGANDGEVAKQMVLGLMIMVPNG